LDVAEPLAGGRYRLLSVLGEGGMATVYRGYDTSLDVDRAIKILSPSMAARANIRRRFEEEARTMARLHHRSIACAPRFQDLPRPIVHVRGLDL
jgi:serine/threonine-protein kinase